MKSTFVGLSRSAFTIAFLALAACGGSDHHSSGTPTPVPLPALCANAFSDDATSSTQSARQQRADAPAAVPLSSCMLGADRSVTIGGGSGECGPDVVVDKDFTGAKGLGKITINSGGKLVFPDLNHIDENHPEVAPIATLNLETTGILINDRGLFGIGTAVCPIGYHEGAHATVTFTGERDKTCDPVKGCDDASIKGIEVKSGGTLRLYGSKGVPNPAADAGAPGVSWTVLRQTAAVGDKELKLAEDVTKGQRPWERGDWIVLGTSSFNPVESEFVQLAAPPTSDGAAGSTVKLVRELVYSHFGSDAPTPSQQCDVGGTLTDVACGSVSDCKAPCTSAPSALNYHDPVERNFGIDERAEVGLISRSITLTAKMPAPPPADGDVLAADPGLHWGGEIRVLGNDAEPPKVAIVGVELEKFGKDQLGSYPIHLHMVGDAKNQPLIAANSIHHSYNKCITVHMSSNLTFADNVCARIVGHMFYEEYGSEENISFQRNLGLGAMSNSFDIYKVRTTGNCTLDGCPPPHDVSRSELLKEYWWKGDNLANRVDYNYDGFNIPNTDDQNNPSRGSCQTFDNNGGFIPGQAPNSSAHAGNCTAKETYTEPASGFWLTNPSAELIGNAIGGCQGVGRAFWWVPPSGEIPINGTMQEVQYKPLGIPGHPHAFLNNRGHGCYSGFYAEQEYSVHSAVLTPHDDGTATGKPIIAEFTGMTATRNRFRGVWLRPTWFVVRDGRFAMNRENVSLVTSGGIDGNAPGVWALLADSVIAGVSQNNVDRFGPCPFQNQLGNFTGSSLGCIEHTPIPTGAVAHSADEVGTGYPDPRWNMFGYMLYDGPVRVFDDRFVNFKSDVSSLLTAADNGALGLYTSFNTPTAQICVDGVNKFTQCTTDTQCCPDKPIPPPECRNEPRCKQDPCPADCQVPVNPCPGFCPLPTTGAKVCRTGSNANRTCTSDADCCSDNKCGGSCNAAHFVYEGDAALGWFQSNQSSYPTGTVTRGLSFENTDLRHQIYTELVSLNLEFNDGDKNTAVIDEDGTLTGFGVGDPRNGHNPPKGIFPISLNNLPFNATGNSVDECFSRGRQNDEFEGRDSSLISAGSMGTLEFSSLYPFKDSLADGTPIAFPGTKDDVTHTQFLTFTRDDLERDSTGAPRRDEHGNVIHADMTLHSRDGRGVWEPKVTSGFGYTVAASPAPNFPASTGKAGLAHILDVGVADVVKPDISATNPFFVRVGICYTNADGSHPQDPAKFGITRGYKFYTGGAVNDADPELQQYSKRLDCTNLDSLHLDNITTPTCPGPRPRSVPKPGSGICPPGSTDGSTADTCVFPTDNLDRVDSAAQMLNGDGTPNLETFFYDKSTGMLFMWVAQDEPNPVAASPLGSCTGDPKTDNAACPKVDEGETYYACPANGCHIYFVKLDDPTYVPGASNCQPYETYTGGPFAPQRELVLAGTTTPIKQTLAFDKVGDPFNTATNDTDPQCKETMLAPTGESSLSAVGTPVNRTSTVRPPAASDESLVAPSNGDPSTGPASPRNPSGGAPSGESMAVSPQAAPLSGAHSANGVPSPPPTATPIPPDTAGPSSAAH